MIKDKSFQEERRDGKTILESMTIQDFFDKGWGVEQVIAVRWKSEAGNIEVKNPEGILAEVLPDRSGVAALLTVDGNRVLKVFSSDGSEQLVVPNQQKVGGKVLKGVFEWFEPSTTKDGVSFGVVFSDWSSGVSYQLDINPTNGLVNSEKLNR